MNIAKFILLALLFTLVSCNREELRDDAKETPIGSVLSGETRSSAEYFKRVSEQNSKATQSPWQPKTDGRF